MTDLKKPSRLFRRHRADRPLVSGATDFAASSWALLLLIPLVMVILWFVLRMGRLAPEGDCRSVTRHCTAVASSFRLSQA